MRWLRNNRRWGSRLALLALMLQLALTFGHVHADSLVTSASPELTLSAGSPADQNHPGDRHDDCAICAAVHLAGNLVLPTPAVIQVPNHVPVTWQASADRAAEFTRIEIFRARGPPQA
jgi:hypothetical protein